MDRETTGIIRGSEVRPPDCELVAAALLKLAPGPRTRRWGHLPLALIDAVFSINASYASTAAAVKRYAHWAKLEDVLVPCPYNSKVLRPGEQSVSAFLETVKGLDGKDLACVYGNRGRTSTHSTSILKAEAVTAMARILADEGIETLPDAAALLEDTGRLEAVSTKLDSVPGAGAAGVRTGYLWMNAGSDTGVKPDRHILGWLADITGAPVTPARARTLLAEAAALAAVSPWEADHAVWSARRGR